MQTRFVICLLVAAAVWPAAADVPGVYAITGGTVHPVSGPDLPGGVVVIREGLIESVGSGVAIPPDATVIDAKGMHVYPGLIDAQTSLGFTAPPRRASGSESQTARSEPAPDTSPAFRAFDNAKISEDEVDARRAIGVTTIVTAPSFGIFSGQSAVLNLSSGPAESRAIRLPFAQQIAFNPRPTWTFPDSLMGVIAHIRQTLLDAQQHSAARSIYERNPTGLQRPAESTSLDALGPVLRREIPVVFIADTEPMMRRAQAIAREFNLRYVLSGARQAYKMTDDLKRAGAPVLVSVKWVAPPARKEDREEQPLRVIRDRQLAPTTPAALVKAGVSFALVSGGGKTGDFLPGIRKAIENGLTEADALRAVTLSPARILGVDRQLGSLDRGKIANVIVTTKPVFEKDVKVSRIFIDGREIRLPTEPPGEKDEAEAPAPIDGGWSLSVKTPQGDASIQVTLRLEDGRLTGTFSGDRGSGDIRNGTLDGATIEFAITASAEGETSDWVFRGTVRGSSMEGTVTTNLGTFPFTGSKAQ